MGRSKKSSLSEQSVLIVGGGGFLGRAILNLLETSNEIEVAYTSLEPIPNLNCRYIKLDILSQQDFDHLGNDFDIVINLIGQISNPTNLCFRLNTEGLFNLIQYVKKSSSRLIQISSVAVYGSSNSTISEESSLSPETPYGSFKANAEFLIEKFLENGQYTILRLSNLYGTNQQKGIIAYFLSSIKTGEKLYFNNNGNMSRYFLNVQDAARLIISLTTFFCPGVYNFIGPDRYSIKELVDLFKEIAGQYFKVNYSRDIPCEQIFGYDNTKFDNTFNFQYKINLHSFLKQEIKVFNDC